MQTILIIFYLSLSLVNIIKFIRKCVIHQDKSIFLWHLKSNCAHILLACNQQACNFDKSITKLIIYHTEWNKLVQFKFFSLNYPRIVGTNVTGREGSKRIAKGERFFPINKVILHHAQAHVTCVSLQAPCCIIISYNLRRYTRQISYNTSALSGNLSTWTILKVRITFGRLINWSLLRKIIYFK